MKLRTSTIEKLDKELHDVLVIGGGINGAVAAAALSGKGARVALIDRRDFAGFTSQQSSNLAWGGIKYLESHDFCLVRNLCKSRNHLIENYPSQIQEIRFFTTIEKGFRFHPWFIWAGTWVYWLFGNGFTRMPKLLNKRMTELEEPVVNTSNYFGGFEYSDAFLRDNDARFVFQFIRSAMDRGCLAANYVESLGSRRENGVWVTRVRDGVSGESFEIRSRVLINAAGPYVDEHNALTGEKTEHQHVFSKGIHLIVPQITPNHRILTFFADDGRLFFAIPMDNRTCIGTTDTRVDAPESEVTEEDRQFVLDNINKRLNLAQPLTTRDIIAERCGVRPLVIRRTGGSNERDWLLMSRKHEVDINRDTAHISIFGGKLTDCVNVGNEIVGLVAEMGVDMPLPRCKWYGEPPASVHDEFDRQARLINLDGYCRDVSSEPLSERLWRRYDKRALELLAMIRQDPRQAEVIIEGADYIRGEIALIRDQEMVTCLEDFLRRRSKISLIMRPEDIRRSEGLREVCAILFGDRAQEKYDEYFQACGVEAPQSA